MEDEDQWLPSIGEIITIEDFSGSRFVVASRHEGGMGVVFRLSQLNPLLPDLALKLLAAGSDFKSAEREARIWVSIGSGPHIAEAYWAGLWKHRPAILARWYDGVASSIPPEHWIDNDFIAFARKLIVGLKYAYETGGIIHRDIKPANVLLDKELNPYITDFGVALMAARDPMNLTDVRDVVFTSAKTMLTGNTSGTLSYMAPEIFGGEHESVMTDIYSLGVTLFELLTGEHPYAGPETDWRFHPRVRKDVLERSNRFSGATIAQRAILAAIALDPYARYPDYDFLLKDLEDRAPVVSEGPNAEKMKVEDAAAAVNLATVYRNQGEPDRADALLQSALRSAPDNPVILNACGSTCARRGEFVKAIRAWSKACSHIENNDGLYANAVYLDPLANLARHLVLVGNFGDAAMWLRRAYGWAEKHNMTASLLYPEFGWLHLYDCKPDEAAISLRLHIARTQSDVAAATWLTLSCMLESEVGSSESHLCRCFGTGEDWDTATTLAATLVALSGTSPEARQLLPAAFSALGRCMTTRNVSLLQALEIAQPSAEALRPFCGEFVELLDQLVTGGRNHEMA